jgi:hypothetical protein
MADRRKYSRELPRGKDPFGPFKLPELFIGALQSSTAKSVSGWGNVNKIRATIAR